MATKWLGLDANEPESDVANYKGVEIPGVGVVTVADVVVVEEDGDEHTGLVTHLTESAQGSLLTVRWFYSLDNIASELDDIATVREECGERDLFISDQVGDIELSMVKRRVPVRFPALGLTLSACPGVLEPPLVCNRAIKSSLSTTLPAAGPRLQRLVLEAVRSQECLDCEMIALQHQSSLKVKVGGRDAAGASTGSKRRRPQSAEAVVKRLTPHIVIAGSFVSGAAGDQLAGNAAHMLMRDAVVPPFAPRAKVADPSWWRRHRSRMSLHAAQASHAMRHNREHKPVQPTVPSASSAGEDDGAQGAAGRVSSRAESAAKAAAAAKSLQVVGKRRSARLGDGFQVPLPALEAKAAPLPPAPAAAPASSAAASSSSSSSAAASSTSSAAATTGEADLPVPAAGGAGAQLPEPGIGGERVDPDDDELLRLDECETWTSEQEAAFAEAFTRLGKDYHNIARMVPGKSPTDCVAYYFAHKHDKANLGKVLAERAKERVERVAAYAAEKAKARAARGEGGDQSGRDGASGGSPVDGASVEEESDAAASGSSASGRRPRSLRNAARASTRPRHTGGDQQSREELAQCALWSAQDGKAFCSLCHEVLDEGSLLWCAISSCRRTVCMRCYRSDATRYRTRLSDTTWKGATKSPFWCCLDCCAPAPEDLDLVHEANAVHDAAALEAVAHGHGRRQSRRKRRPSGKAAAAAATDGSKRGRRRRATATLADAERSAMEYQLGARGGDGAAAATEAELRAQDEDVAITYATPNDAVDWLQGVETRYGADSKRMQKLKEAIALHGAGQWSERKFARRVLRLLRDSPDLCRAFVIFLSPGLRQRFMLSVHAVERDLAVQQYHWAASAIATQPPLPTAITAADMYQQAQLPAPEAKEAADGEEEEEEAEEEEAAAPGGGPAFWPQLQPGVADPAFARLESIGKRN